jgi:hypothetical protein
MIYPIENGIYAIKARCQTYQRFFKWMILSPFGLLSQESKASSIRVITIRSEVYIFYRYHHTTQNIFDGTILRSIPYQKSFSILS